MGTLWVCHFPSFATALLCRTCKLSPTHLLQPSLPLSQFHARASQTTTTTTTTTRTRTRRSRRLKSDAEICHDIRQFLASVGLPEHHIPSTKELLLHGWNDLAKIVRRRGHKQIQELLTTDSLNFCQDSLTGQSEKVESLVNDVTESTEFLMGSSSSSLYADSALSEDECDSVAANSSVEDGLGEVKDHAQDESEGSFYPVPTKASDNESNSLGEGLYPNFDSRSSTPTEISVESPYETMQSEGSFYRVTTEASNNESNSLGEVLYPNFDSRSSAPTEISGESPYETMQSEGSFYPAPTEASDNESNSLGEGLYPSFDSQSSTPTEISGESPYETMPSDIGTADKELSGLPSLDGLDDSNANIAEDVPMTSEISVREDLAGDNRSDSIVHSADNHHTLSNLSLKEKVANFIQNGDLDPVEDGDDSQESKGYTESESTVDIPLGAHPPKDNNFMEPQGNSLTSKQIVPPGAPDQPLWDDRMPHEDVTTDFDKDMDTKALKVQNESEINHLKFMLYQKELELSRLKEQIEKEKRALSVLQTKAEEEISKARKLISEKDAELLVAEESLSGLKEVQIEFCGDGDVVEVAGSFNGWHNRIKLDPQSSTSSMDIVGSRFQIF